MRGSLDHVCGCFPTGRHYPGIAERIAAAVETIEGLCEDFAAADVWTGFPIAVVDFETTGREAGRDRIVEIGIVRLLDGEVQDRHSILVNPGMPIAQDASAVHGITDDDVANEPPLEEVMPRVLELLRGHLPVAYNAEFDRTFLHAEFARVASRLELPSALPPALQPKVIWVDPLVWTREILRDLQSRALADVCAHLGVALERAHRATDDAEATGRVLLHMAGQMPRTYGELIRLQGRYAARHEAELSAWRNRRRY
ncbi:MAG: exonuclease domain-containing protein [Myxococcota bacterium]